MHNYAVYELIWKRKHFWKKKVVVEQIEMMDGFTDPYDSDCLADQMREDHPKRDFITSEKEKEYDDENYW